MVTLREDKYAKDNGKTGPELVSGRMQLRN
jgi:hypothetical protein